jgi:hypothetical protein
MNVLKTVSDLLKEPIKSVEFGYLPTSIHRYPVTWIQLDKPINVRVGQVVWISIEYSKTQSFITRPLIIEDIVGTRIVLKGIFQLPRVHTKNNTARSWTYGESNLSLLYQNTGKIYLH